jgi:hypothetical protein
MSGTGKSTALAALGRRGFHVVDTDSPGWSEWVPTADGGVGEWLWRDGPIRRLLGSARDRPLYVSGCVSNQGALYELFDAIVLLSAPVEVILERVSTRTTNDYGKDAAERDRIVSDLRSVEPLLRATCTHEIDATGPIHEVVTTLVAIGRNAATTPR